MEIIDLLFYKTDNMTGKRIGKTKTISTTLFIIFFISFLHIYLTSPNLNFGLGVSIISSIILASVFVVPVAAVGWILGKLLNSNKSNNTQAPYNQQFNTYPNNQSTYQENYQNPNNYNQNNNYPNNQNNNVSEIQNNNYQKENNENKNNEYINNKQVNNSENINYANEFKTAIENNKAESAAEILSKWENQNNQDANYQYAKIIFDGMPPSNVSLIELQNWFETADKMDAKDNSLKEWFQSVAKQVINMNEENKV